MTLGLRITRKTDGAEFVVTGYHGGEFVIAPTEAFATPEALSRAALISEFDVASDDLAVPPTEADILAARDREATMVVARARAAVGETEPRRRGRRMTEPPAGSPEAIFHRIAGER